jgi:hypothetical protein
MVGSVVSKVLWVGRVASAVFGLALVLALVFGVATAAFGANGSNFILGQTNVATLITRLGGPDGVNGAMFEVHNSNVGTNDTALSLKVQGGEPPMKVNSATKVTNLNADKLDGKHAGGFLPNATYTNSQSTTGTHIGGGVFLAEDYCDAGDVLLSGGHFGLDAGTTLVASGPDAFHDGWQLQWKNDGTADSITVSVYCANF